MENNTILENNEVTLSGLVAEVPEYDHEVFGEKFYKFTVEAVRMSGYSDYVPVIISERLIDLAMIKFDSDNHLRTYIKLTGQFRSHNLYDAEDNKKKLILSVFARDVLDLQVFNDELSDESDQEIQIENDLNKITLHGFICKPPKYRKTPLGREITDGLIAVNRPYGKSDYLPFITWGRNARYASTLELGDEIVIEGRIQSREYTKLDDHGDPKKKIAYEVSASKISLIADSDNINE